MITAQKAYQIASTGSDFSAKVDTMIKAGQVAKVFKGDLEGQKKPNKNFVKWATDRGLVSTDVAVKKVRGAGVGRGGYIEAVKTALGKDAALADQFKALEKSINDKLKAANSKLEAFSYFKDHAFVKPTAPAAAAAVPATK